MAARASAAADLYSAQYQQTAVHTGLPQEKPQPARRVKAKLEIAPFAVIGALVVLFLLVMVIQTQVRLFEYKTTQSQLTQQLSEIDTKLTQLRSDYEGKVNLRAIEQEAKAIGMRKPTASQTVYLSIAGADSAEVLHYEQKSFFGTLWDAISDGFRGVVEYFG